MPRESLDCGTLICHLRGKLASQPVSEFTREAYQLRRSQAVAGERFASIYL